MSEYREPPTEIDVGTRTHVVAFSTSGDFLLCGHSAGVGLWRVADGRELSTLGAVRVTSLAVSTDGRWIAAGTFGGDVIVWDAKTYDRKYVWEQKDLSTSTINGVDFSPDSTRLVSASDSANFTATIWDLVTGSQALRLGHARGVLAAKYSPQGDRIATAIYKGDIPSRVWVRVWDSNNGRLLVDTPVTTFAHEWGGGLAWINNCVLVAADKKIKKLEGSTVVSEMQLHDQYGDSNSQIVLPRHEKFIVYSGKRRVKFYEMTTHTELAQLAQQTLTSHSAPIAVSPDSQSLAIAYGQDTKVTIKRLSNVKAPFIEIDIAVLECWKLDQLADAEALLTSAVAASSRSIHHVFASRALVRARLQNRDAAMDDANRSIKAQPSLIGYIAKGLVHASNGEKQKAYRACDIAFEHCHSSHVGFLLLIKAIIVCLAGEYSDALSRMDDLINTLHFNSVGHTVQVYMHLLVGNSRMERHDYEGAIRSFQRARVQTRPFVESRTLRIVSLISGWKFDNLCIIIRRQLCEALYAAGYGHEAGRMVLETANTFRDGIYANNGFTKWIYEFTSRCINAPVHDMDAVRTYKLPTLHPISPTPSPLLKEWARASLACQPWKDSLAAAIGFTVPRSVVYRALCERLEMIDRVADASECFLQMLKEIAAETTEHSVHTERIETEATEHEHGEWVEAFRRRCLKRLEHHGDFAVDKQQYDNAIIHYSAALSLELPVPRIFIKRSKTYMAKGLWKDALHDANQAMAFPSSPWDHKNVLAEWAKLNLMNGLWKGALAATQHFEVPRLSICQSLCEGLEVAEGVLDAVECFHEVAGQMLARKTTQEEAEWVRDFRYRCSEKLEYFGDVETDSERPNEAIKYYSAMLSIYPTNTQGFSIVQSKVCMAKGLWKDALDYANEAIALDATTPWGYGMKHAALHGAGRHDDAIRAFETMLARMEQSADARIRERRGRYVTPSSTRAMICEIVAQTIRHLPRVLINTTTGQLQNKAEQEATFMSLPVVNELVSSMTTRIDRGRVKREVKLFFRYVMLSHRWEEKEPLFQQVIRTTVYDLDISPTHDKLQRFCKIVQDAGFIWAWSDTCCINKEDHFVLQEALVAMFKWYRLSAMVIVFLRGVRSPGKLGDLAQSLWNTRAWTLQEYVAAKVARFYTEDWTPYLNLNTFNHKESPEIISEMEMATGVSAQQLARIRPGLSSIREKLHLASMRYTTLIEDAAYSLLGIFSVSGLSAIYGEGENALGRLLAHILAVSGETNILAWTGQSGRHNSCLPARISVFSHSAVSHLPRAIEDSQMQKVIARLRTDSHYIDQSIRLYDRLSELPAPWFAASRMKLPCIAFRLPSLSRSESGHVYYVETPMFGRVEIRTRQDLSRASSLYLIHPWLDVLLDREQAHVGALMEGEDVEDADLSSWDTDDADYSDGQGASSLLGEPTSPTCMRTDAVPLNTETRALQLVARLRQPFGAILLSLTSTRRRAGVYRRVAADSEITVQLLESVSLSEILRKVRILDVL